MHVGSFQERHFLAIKKLRKPTQGEGGRAMGVSDREGIMGSQALHGYPTKKFRLFSLGGSASQTPRNSRPPASPIHIGFVMQIS